MHTQLADFVKALPEHDELQSILRACVHCGFCNAGCPTYAELNNELDGPRGRIYLLKQALEGQPVSRVTQQHIDRCLNCRACESICPSGVHYGRLVDLAQPIIAQQVRRPFKQRLIRLLALHVFSYRQRFQSAFQLGLWLKPLLPKSLKAKLHKPAKVAYPTRLPTSNRTMLLLTGCVQPTLAPNIDEQCIAVFARLGITLIPVTGQCCAALPYHLADHERAKHFARTNIDLCLSQIEQGAEAIISSASACTLMLKNYAELLQYDDEYRDKAQHFSALCKDLSEILAQEDLQRLTPETKTLAFHAPCTLQHGQRLTGQVEAVLTRLGHHLLPIAQAELCCGSAGVYSLLQPDLSARLREQKLTSLSATKPELIATANIGCLNHLHNDSIRVVHWIELCL
ncbi:glycolate oxidase subunit GlcF [Methylocucumis oryzae]|uniref:Glycolate oxidase iron-sulfur subunit n=1 Tax=Methylocucumis oryzae TaxID=1632867 RepID=A0A0F3IJJ9_9GAMM|nr:glycolate oxidase subunit GlcF [Methylocucumis oryzae]KJV05724.1 glycolate oxidase iron-sulfur subunit [Methylocucumis oryzae]